MATLAAKKRAPVARKPAKAKTAPEKKAAAPKKIKVVRDSFSMPQEDYALIGKMKERAHAAGMPVKKSALLRAGLQLLDKCAAAQFKRVLTGLAPIKTGRPKKH